MPHNPINNNPSFGPYDYHQVRPGTTEYVSHSFDERILTEAEFDDALIDQTWWKRQRYEGSKATAESINKYTDSKFVGVGSASIGDTFTVGDFTDWPGDITYQNLPTVQNVSTALYIANTVIGGTEDPQFATLKNHSYVSVNKILFVNLNDNSVTVVNKTTEPYEEFHRFLTNDFPTGNRATAKLIDESISNNMTETYRVKMNKGFLLKSFKFVHAGEFYGMDTGSLPGTDVLTFNNSMYLYKSGSIYNDYVRTGSDSHVALTDAVAERQANILRFRYGVVEMVPKQPVGQPKFSAQAVGPSFNSSSIIQNKFTEQYYSGSFGLISGSSVGTTYPEVLGNLGLGSASRFIGKDTLTFLAQNNSDVDLTEQEKTEVHITFFEGTKDFAPGKHDERSIATFEVDQKRENSDIGDFCGDYLPRNHEILFKGRDDNRFLPTISTYFDSVYNAHPESVSGSQGCPAINTTSTGDPLPHGLSSDYLEDAQVYVQGGALGEVGYIGVVSGNVAGYGDSQEPNMNKDHYISGSFGYELSFLDKSHTLILNLNKEAELFDGIGEKGMVLIPENIHPQVQNNIEYYLAQAGLIDETNSNLQTFNLS
jgi:hypothetical protein